MSISVGDVGVGFASDGMMVAGDGGMVTGDGGAGADALTTVPVRARLTADCGLTMIHGTDDFLIILAFDRKAIICRYL